jgi:hypothetical protein
MDKIMDEADKASIQQQNLIDAAIKRTAKTKIDTGNVLGVCWNCGDETGHECRWCNAQCRDSWESLKK